MAHEAAVLEAFLRGRQAAGASTPEGWVGPGDDASVVPPSAWAAADGSPQSLVACTDALEEGAHFQRGWLSMHELAWKVLAVTLSDLAAVAATPVGWLLTLAWPDDLPADEAAALGAGCAQAERALACPLLGGDTDVSARGLRLCATALGRRSPSERVSRGGGREGDRLYVTGPLGGPAAVVDAWLAGRDIDAERGPREDAVARFRRPSPRVDLGTLLGRRAHAMIDVSDGLATDLAHLAERSRLSAVLDLDAVPVHPACVRHPEMERLVLEGGEDYELLVAAPAGLEAQVPGLVAVGRLVAGEPGRVLHEGRLARAGWHLEALRR
jgi:thiamine-monophosphate kinase